MPRSRGRVSGVALQALVGAMRGRPAQRLLATLVRRQLGIEALAELGEGPRGALPLDCYPTPARPLQRRESAAESPAPAAPWPRSVAAFATAYAAGTAQPEGVLERALGHARQLATLTPSRGPLLTYDSERARVAAGESRARLVRGASRGPLDGVPIAVQEAFDIEGEPTRLGSAWRGSTPALRDATVVARLRAAGAVLLGHTPMSEHGLNPFGINPHRTMPRNAHDAGRLAGGSATGSAVAVATGVAPLALGLDGGGSLRIPAALNGVFALKPTLGRVPATGCGGRSGSTIATPGPFATCAHDLALFLEATAGPDPEDLASLRQPLLERGSLLAALHTSVAGLRIGVDEQEWVAARTTTATPARAALEALTRAGAELVSVRLPMARHAPAIGYLTLGLEGLAGLREARRGHERLLGSDTRLLIAALAQNGPDDYLDAQRLRATLRAEVAAALRDVDVLALPTTAHAAPTVSDREATRGFVDAMALDGLCRFAFLADLTGLPAGTAPVGVDDDGLPVGLQLIADAWDEAAVLTVMSALERLGVAALRRPSVAIDVLESA